MRLLEAWIRFTEAMWPLIAVMIVCLVVVVVVRTWRHDRGLAVRAERETCAEVAAALTLPPEYSEQQRSIAGEPLRRGHGPVDVDDGHLIVRAERLFDERPCRRPRDAPSPRRTIPHWRR